MRSSVYSYTLNCEILTSVITVHGLQCYTRILPQCRPTDRVETQDCDRRYVLHETWCCIATRATFRSPRFSGVRLWTVITFQTLQWEIGDKSGSWHKYVTPRTVKRLVQQLVQRSMQNCSCKFQPSPRHTNDGNGCQTFTLLCAELCTERNRTRRNI